MWFDIDCLSLYAYTNRRAQSCLVLLQTVYVLSQRCWSCLVQRDIRTFIILSSYWINLLICLYGHSFIHCGSCVDVNLTHCSVQYMRVDVNRVLQGHSPIHPSIRLYVKLSVCLHGYCSCVYMNLVIKCLLDYLSLSSVYLYLKCYQVLT